MTIRQAYEAIARDNLRKDGVSLTEARMTFDEWWQTYWTPTEQPPVFDAAMKEIAENAWIAATVAERERCARVAEGMERPDDRHWMKESVYDTLRRETAAEIRRKP